MDAFLTAIYPIVNLPSVLFVFAIGTVLVTAGVFFVTDIRQSNDAVRHNYPVLGRFRSLFSALGEFFPPVFLCDGS